VGRRSYAVFDLFTPFTALTSNAIWAVQLSHGCVRLSVKNAAALWELVKRQKMANTTVVLSGTIPNAGPPAVARSRPLPLTTDDPSDNAPLPQYQPRYDDNRPPLPFPFSIFGR
jgi:hypothetical protein